MTVSIKGLSFTGGNQLVFDTLHIAGQSDIVADEITDTLTLAAGSGITIVTDAATDTATISAAATGSNTGDQNLFSTIAVSGQSNVVADALSDTLTLTEGNGITITTNATTDTVTFAAAATGTNTGDQLVFKTIAVSGQSDIVADTTTDTLTFATDGTMAFTTDAGTDTITLSNSTLATKLAIENNTYTYYTAAYTTPGGIGTYTITPDPLPASLTPGMSYLVRINDSPAGIGTIKFNITGQTALQMVTPDGVNVSEYNFNLSSSGRIFKITLIDWTGSNKWSINEFGAYTTISVFGLGSVVARHPNETLTLRAYDGLSIVNTTTAEVDQLNFYNTANVFKTIAVSGQSDVVADSLTDTLTLAMGNGVTITTDATTDTVTFAVSGTNSGTNTGDQSVFSTIAVSGQDNVVADSTSDTLTIAASTNITITTTAASDTVTISAPNVATKAAVQNNTYTGFAATYNSGTNTYAVTTSPVQGSLVDYSEFIIRPDATNSTGASSLISLDGLTAKIMYFEDLSTIPVSYFVAGSNYKVRYNAGVDKFTIDRAPDAASNVFKTIAVSGQSDVVADSATDTLTIAAGAKIAITTDASSDTVTIATTGAAASGANTDITSVYLNNTGLKIKDTNASHGLSIVPGSDLTADRVLTITTGDAARTVTINGNTTLTGTNTGDQTITLTGDVTGSGTGSFATTIAENVITTAMIQDNSVTINKIINDAVNVNKLTTDSVSTAKIIDANVTTAKIADGNITTGKLDTGAVTAVKAALDAYKGSQSDKVFMGTATLSSGTATVTDSGVTAAGSLIFLTAQDSSTIGVLQVGTITDNTSFVINSTVGADSGVVAFWRVGP